MGNSAPPPASIDLVESFARRRGADVEIVLQEPTEGQDATVAQLRRLGVTVEGSAELVDDDRGRRLVLRLPRAGIADGRWPVFLVTPTGDSHRVQARLLVQGERPLVLLWGGHSTTGDDLPRTPSAQRKVAETGGRVLDAALRPLPAHNAVAVRRGLRRAARAVLR